MAWRIHDSVIRGEIDNRERGIVRGKLWLDGIAEPVVLELKGNACADLAGCFLTFENPLETLPMRKDAEMHPLQDGVVGDITASRKVRVWDMPFDEAYERKKRGLPVPEHMANSLYLEWFSPLSGRVVIESADYKMTISPPTWTMRPEDEEQRRKDAANAFSEFMTKLTEALEAAKHQPSEDKEWDEFDYEKLMRESDARTDKFMELLDKYEDHPDSDEIIAREMGWDKVGEEKLEEGEEDEDVLDADEINRISTDAVDNPPAPDPATEGVDWIRDDEDDIGHPLYFRASAGCMKLWQECRQMPDSKSDDEDLCALLSEYQITTAKVAGALNSLAYGRDICDGAFIVAYLKRALNHLHAAQAALEKVASKDLLPENTVTRTRGELFSVREDILKLMTEFRGLK